MRPPSPLAGSIELALDLDLAGDPVEARSGRAHLRLLPPLPSLSLTPTDPDPDHHGSLGDTPPR